MGETRNGLLVVTSVAHILNRAQHHAFWQQLRSDLVALRSHGLVINRYHDATPHFCKFGHLQGQIYQDAKYLIPDPARQNMYKAVQFQKLLLTKGARSVPPSGIVELFGQAIDVHWQATAPNAGASSHELLTSPMLIQSTNASTLFRAFENGCDALNLESIHELAGLCKVFLISEVADNVSANNRRKAAYSQQLPANCLFASSLSCSVHKVHNIIQYPLDMRALVGDVYALSFVVSQPLHRNAMIAALRDIVRSELSVVDHCDARSDQHREDVLRHTLERRWCFVRGSLMPGANVLATRGGGHSQLGCGSN